MDNIPSADGVKRRACVNCTTVKAKCSPFAKDLCERCHRLGKPCHYLEVSKTRRKVREVPRMRVLEAKIDKLVTDVSLLTQNTSSTPSIKELSTSYDVRSIHSTSSSSGNTQLFSVEDMPSTSDGTSEYDTLEISDQCSLTLNEAESYLRTFRSSATAQFPFVVLGRGVTAQYLHRERPFLFLAIIATTASTNPALQRQLGVEIKKRISLQIMMQAEKSLDLLQGLLVYLARYHFFFQPHAPQMFLILQLCITLIHELGIDRQSADRKPKSAAKVGAVDKSEQIEPAQNKLAEKRALLGTYCLSASFSIAFRKRSVMTLTKYMEKCCQSLADANEVASDQWISPIVRLHALSRYISDELCYDNVEDSELRGEGAMKQMTEAFVRELESLKANMPSGSGGNATLLLDIHFLSTWIHEVALHEQYWPTPESSPSNSILQSKMLWAIIRSNKAYLTEFLSLPSSELLHLTILTWPKLCYILIVHVKTILFHADSSLAYCNSRQADAHDELRPALPPEAEIFWDPALAAKEGEMRRLSLLLLDKLSSVAYGTDGLAEEPNAIYHFYLTLKVLLANFETQSRLFEDGNKNGNGESRASAGEISDARQEQRDGFPPQGGAAPLAPNAALFTEEGFIGENGEFAGGMSFDFSLPVGLIEEEMWDSMLLDFTAMPLP